MWKLLFVLIISMSACLVNAEDVWTSWRVFDNGNVIDLAMDKQGGIWAVHEGGSVARFNGEKWVPFTMQVSGFIGPGMRCVAVDSSGVVWFLSKARNSIISFDGLTWKEHGTGPEQARNIAVDGNNRIWVGTDYHGLWKYDGRNWTSYNPRDGEMQSSSCTTLAIDNDNSLWVSQDSFLGRFNGSHWHYPGIISNDRVLAITIDRNGTKWFGLDTKGIVRYTGGIATEYNPFPFSSAIGANRTVAAAVDSEGIVWFGKYNGIVFFNGEQWQQFTQENSGLPSNFISKIIVDNNNRKWIASSEGVTRLDNRSTTPFLRLLAPKGGQEWCQGDVREIVWASNGIGTILIEYSDDGGQTWNKVSTNVDVSSKHFFWTVPKIDSRKVSIRISDTGGSGLNSMSDKYFSVSKSFVRVEYPNGMETIDTVVPSAVRWSSYGLKTVRVECSYDAGTTWMTVLDHWFGETGSCRFYVPAIPSTECLLRISDASRPEIFDISDSLFSLSIPGKITEDGIWSFIPYPALMWDPYGSPKTGDRIPIAVDHDGIVWIADRDENIWSFSQGAWIRYTKEITGADHSPLEIFVDSRNNKWFSYEAKIIRYNNIRWEDVYTGVSWSFHIAEDYDGTMWFAGVWNGVAGYTAEGQLKRYYARDMGVPYENFFSVGVDANNVKLLGYADYSYGMGGIVGFDGSKWLSLNELNSHIGGTQVSNIVQLSNGTMAFLVSNKKVVLFDGTHYKDIYVVPWEIAGDRNAGLWTIALNGTGSFYDFHKRKGIMRYSEGKSYWYYTVPPYFDEFLNITVDTKNQKWIPTRKGIWCFRENQPTTISGNRPTAFNLSPAHPNPFNHSTVLNFSLPFDGTVSLTVYNVMGQMIRTLVSGRYHAGNHSIRWNGTDDSGDEVSSGIYFAQLMSNRDTRVVKMMLLR